MVSALLNYLVISQRSFTGPDDGKLHVPVYADDDLYSQMYDLFVTPRNLIIIGMAWGLALLFGKMLPLRWIRTYKSHVAPALMLAVCSAMVWVSGTRPDIKSIGWRISLGIILAVVCQVVPILLIWLAEKYLPEKMVQAIRRILM